MCQRIFFKDFSVDDNLGAVPGSKASKLFMLCQRSDHQTPCKPGQKWHCVRDGFRFVVELKTQIILIKYVYILNLFCRWRKHKCRTKKRTNKLLDGLSKCTCFSVNGNLYTKLEMKKNKDHRLK